MAYSYTERKRIRKSFGSRDSVLEVPYLLSRCQKTLENRDYSGFLVHSGKNSIPTSAKSWSALSDTPAS
ncbi:hypothetical protein ACSLNH_16980, partial [Comamonas kerstersii]|uniref:hypothetical protein n=1 Tax=Comamonas kerstersii TaxID=225992 RepID=UPI003EE32647